MPNFFYFDASGQKQGPVGDEQLQSLVTQGIITPETPLETEAGHKGKAGQIPSLKFPGSASPQSVPPSPFQASPPPGNAFCTYCGKPIAEQAVACVSCGAAPVGHRNFCRSCGVALNPAQVICIRCGTGIKAAGASRFGGSGVGTGTSWPKNKLTAGILGILLGGCGAQKYYMGSWGWGIVFTAALFVTVGFSGLVTGIIGLVEGIMWLMMSDEDFAEKYPPETESPFRW